MEIIDSYLEKRLMEHLSKLNREAIPSILPEFEELAKTEELYPEALKREIEFFKFVIDYDDVGDSDYASSWRVGKRN